jgi:malate dehydrogenase
MSQETIARLVQRTRDGGAEIVALLKSGSAYYAPGAATGEMIDAILQDRHKILPCAAYLQGEYGVQGLFVGVPARLGHIGVEEVVEVELTDDERREFGRSAAAVKELVEKLGAYA